MNRTEDKRLHPRVDRRLSVRAAHDGGVDFETLNLSAGGLFCTSPAWVAPMTRMALSLSLPAADGRTPAVVQGEAVVVRTEPAAPQIRHDGGYRIALFFSRMTEEHRRILQDYLASRSA